MNKKWLPHIISAGALVFFIVLGLACASAPEYSDSVANPGEEIPMLVNTTWDLTVNTWSEVWNEVIVFQSEGRLFYSSPTRTSSNNPSGVWQRTGDTIIFTLYRLGNYLFNGTYYDSRTIKGTWESGRNRGEFIMLLLIE